MFIWNKHVVIGTDTQAVIFYNVMTELQHWFTVLGMELKALVSFLGISIIQPENGLLIKWVPAFLPFIPKLLNSYCLKYILLLWELCWNGHSWSHTNCKYMHLIPEFIPVGGAPLHACLWHHFNHVGTLWYKQMLVKFWYYLLYFRHVT